MRGLIVIIICMFYVSSSSAVYIRDKVSDTGEISLSEDEPNKALLNEQVQGLQFVETDREYVPELQKRNKMPDNEEVAATEEQDNEYDTDLISENNFRDNGDDTPSIAVKRVGLEENSESLDTEDDYTGEAETKDAEPDNASESGSGGDTDENNSMSNEGESMVEEEQTPEVEAESGAAESGDSDVAVISQEKSSEDDENNNNNSESGSGAVQDEAENARLQTVNEPKTHYDTGIRKRDKIPVPEEKSTNAKRQYISRPRFVIRDGYVYMKAPPMTQKTIVTTHIPRPPMVMSYNAFLHRYRGGYPPYAGVPGMGRHGRRLLFPSQQYSDDGYDVDDHNEECKKMNSIFKFV